MNVGVTSADSIDLLRETPGFGDVGDDVLARIVDASSELNMPAGQVLIRADDPGAGMFVLQEGTVLVEGHGRTIELTAGSVFGELSLLVPEATRVARVRATTPVRCLVLDRAAFEDLLDEPAFTRAMLQVVAQRLWDVMRGQ
jgi:CRP-like cAMP-binding protein